MSDTQSVFTQNEKDEYKCNKCENVTVDLGSAKSHYLSKHAEQQSLVDAIKQYIAKNEFKQHTARDETDRRRKFAGIWLASTSGRWANGREQTRWIEQDLYTLKDGRFIITEENVTCWQGESNSYGIQQYANMNEFLAEAEQDLLDELRSNLSNALFVKIALAEIATEL